MDERVQATLVALAAGFFLYVGLMEVRVYGMLEHAPPRACARAWLRVPSRAWHVQVVAKELVGYETKGSGAFALAKLLALLLGFVLMALLGLWV